MICHVYRSNRKLGTYLYIQEKDDFSHLPDNILTIFGEPEFSLSFNLLPDKVLPQADAKEIMDKLETDGFYLQLPRSDYDLDQIVQALVQGPL